MRNRTVSLLVSSLCFVLALGAVRASLAQIKKPKAASSPAQPTSSSEGAPKISKPSAAPAPAKGVEPRTDASSAPSPPTTSVTPPPPIQTSGSAKPTSISGIAGSYSVQGTQAMVGVKSLSGDIYHVNSSEGWEGVGILEGHLYQGVFRYRKDTGAAMGGVMGQLLIDWIDPGQPAVQMTFTTGKSGSFSGRWTKMGAASERPRPEPSTSTEGRRPDLGEYVYVEELPEVITRVPPEYPPAARAARIQGVVQLQALVAEDGSVADVRVMKGVSGLDEAAIAAVHQWRFKPALAKGRPVAVWVAVPLRFSLN